MIKDFFETYKWDGRPFVLAGMGPSFSRIRDYDTSGYNIIGINKVVREIPVDICSIIDWYIVDRVFQWIDTQCKYLASPYFPHFGCRPHALINLDQVAEKIKFKDKILGYNLSTFSFLKTRSPIIHASYFTAEATLNLIANLGCKEVKAIGIDGGMGERAKEFSDHGACDPRGFDLQWPGMARTIKRHNINYSNLDGSPLNPNLEKLLEQNIHRV